MNLKENMRRFGTKNLQEYGENEFDRSAQMYSGGSKDAGPPPPPPASPPALPGNMEPMDSVEERLETIEDTISKIKSLLSTDSNLPTTDKMEYLNLVLKIEGELNLAQEELDFKPS